MHVLMFIGKWLFYQDKRRSTVLTYERFLEDPIRCLKEVNRLLQLKVSSDVISRVYDECVVKTKKKPRGRSINQTIYPLGWTGMIGVWKTYFSEENYQNYKRVYRHFLECFSWAKKVEEVYPFGKFLQERL